MKLNDILTEDQQKIDEFIPLTKQGRMIRRAEKAGGKDMKATLDKLIQDFAAQLGTQGSKFKTATTDDVVDFLQSKKVDTSDIDMNAPMTPKRIKTIFQTKVKQQMAVKKAAPQAAPAASGQQAAPTASATAKPAAGTSATPAATPKTQKVVYSQVKKSAMSLTPKQKQMLILQLQKGLPKPKAKAKNFTVDKSFDKSQKLSDFGKTGQ